MGCHRHLGCAQAALRPKDPSRWQPACPARMPRAAIVTKPGRLAFSVPKPYSTQAAIEGLGEVEMPMCICTKRWRMGWNVGLHALDQAELISMLSHVGREV